TSGSSRCVRLSTGFRLRSAAWVLDAVVITPPLPLLSKSFRADRVLLPRTSKKSFAGLCPRREPRALESSAIQTPLQGPGQFRSAGSHGSPTGFPSANGRQEEKSCHVR